MVEHLATVPPAQVVSAVVACRTLPVRPAPWGAAVDLAAPSRVGGWGQVGGFVGYMTDLTCTPHPHSRHSLCRGRW